MDFQAHKAQMLAHYTRMAAEPGWQDYARERAAYMAAKQPALYAELPAAVAAASQEARHADRN